MQQLMKRLEIIKAAISLEDEETITLHLGKIGGAADAFPGLESILSHLAALDYAMALRLISDFLHRNAAVSVFADPETAALKMELQGLERRLARLSAERDEVLHVLDEFNRLYSVRLGGLISEILKIQMMIAGAAEALHDDDQAEIRARFAQERRRAQHDYQRFYGAYEGWLAAPRPRDLSEEEAARMKTAYRKASRLCHPDMVAQELKEQATEQFQVLHDAYRMNELEKVEEILSALANGGAFAAASEQVEDKERLRTHIRALREQVESLAGEIRRIRTDDTWELVERLNGEYEVFLAEQERELRLKLERLQHEFMEMV